MLKLVEKSNRVLHKKARPVTIFGSQWQITLDEMYTTMIARGGVGIAANQVGIDRQLAVIQLSDADIRYDILNPRILSRSVSMEKLEEGCLSIPNTLVTKNRHASVVVEYQNIYGAKVVMCVDGLLAKVFQHEIDHLQGRLIDHGLNI